MTEVVVAAVAGFAAVVVALIERSRRQNSREHGETVHRLDRVLRGLGRLEGKLDGHLEQHDKGKL